MGSSCKEGLRGWLNHREIGQKCEKGTKDQLATKLYGSVKQVRTWNPKEHPDHTHHGGIFNFDFATDGSLLVAACERQSFLMFDPLSGKLISAKNNAHSDCVNCVRFLDSRMFATCSDDTTVCLWDARYLKHKVRTLKGHANWVKNIEYAHNAELLVTSGFDGSIYAWDINRYAESDSCHTRLFHTNGLMRTKLTPDASKLVIATAGGYLMVVHNLDLNTLSNDLHGFKPNMYRLMQMSQQPIRQGYQHNNVFTRKRNRVELISDFPEGDDAEMIASLEATPHVRPLFVAKVGGHKGGVSMVISLCLTINNYLQVHPQGWCVVSRNTSSDEAYEWTCVHDIQDKVYNMVSDEGSEINDSSAFRGSSALMTTGKSDSNCSESQASEVGTRRKISLRRSESSTSGSPSQGRSNSNVNTSEEGSSQPLTAASPPFIMSVAVDDNSEGQSVSLAPNPENSRERRNSTSIDDHETENAPVECPTDIQAQEDELSERSSASFSPSHSVTLGESVTFIIRSGAQVAERTLLLLGQSQPPRSQNLHIHRNKHRLTHYVQEPNVGRGFIKEINFSNDGRMICSPFGFGLRLLAFGPQCQELCDLQPERPMQLHELTSNMSHVNSVVASKFSPTHCLLVSGCLNGKVDFHQPLL